MVASLTCKHSSALCIYNVTCCHRGEVASNQERPLQISRIVFGLTLYSFASAMLVAVILWLPVFVFNRNISMACSLERIARGRASCFASDIESSVLTASTKSWPICTQWSCDQVVHTLFAFLSLLNFLSNCRVIKFRNIPFVRSHLNIDQPNALFGHRIAYAYN